MLQEFFTVIDHTTIRDIGNLFRLKQLQIEELKILRTFLKSMKKKKPTRVGNFRSNNYIEYESNGDRNKTLSIEEYLNKNKLFLKDITKNLENSS